MKILFNRNPIEFGNRIQQPTKEEIKNSIGLFRSSIEDAIKFGGDLTREALRAIQLKNNRKYVVVDVKIHMLMPGFLPAIPGWHTDGVPRPEKDKPNLKLQEDKNDTIYHLLVTGEGCLTEFINDPIELEIPNEPTSKLYKIVDEQIENLKIKSVISAPSCQVLTWDWWTLHRGIQAKIHEWRYLIRVAETDNLCPLTDLRDILKTQQQVYVPLNFGW